MEKYFLSSTPMRVYADLYPVTIFYTKNYAKPKLLCFSFLCCLGGLMLVGLSVWWRQRTEQYSMSELNPSPLARPKIDVRRENP